MAVTTSKTTSTSKSSSSTVSSSSSSSSQAVVTSSAATTNTASVVNPSQIASVSTTGGYKFGHLPASLTYYGNPPQITSQVVSVGAVGQSNIVSVAVAEQTATGVDGQASIASLATDTASVDAALASQASAQVGDVASVLNGAAAATNGGLA